MAYDAALAQRVRDQIMGLPGMSEKKMFGGLCFLMYGNMVGGVAGDRLMLRVGPEKYEAALKKKHAMPMTFTGRPMKGMIFVAPEGTTRKTSLASWLKMGLDYAGSLPKK